jgi:hypothetical protein
VPVVGRFRDELSLDDLDPNLAQPSDVGCGVRMTPAHRRAVEVSDSGPCTVPDRRKKQAAWREPSADPP